jgi:hypothetical protein
MFVKVWFEQTERGTMVRGHNNTGMSDGEQEVVGKSLRIEFTLFQ